MRRAGSVPRHRTIRRYAVGCARWSAAVLILLPVTAGCRSDVGWRLLGEEQGAGDAYRTGVATTEAQLTGLWRESGLSGTPGAIDWEREVVIWFGAVYGSGCPVEFRGVVVDGATVHGDIDIIGTPPGCNDDANPHAFVVAVDRPDLPAAPFTVQLGGGEPYLGDPGEEGEATVVEVDLSAAGATAADGELRHDPAPEPQPGPLLVDGDGMPDDGDRYVWQPRPECPGTVLGPLDDAMWQLEQVGPEGAQQWEEAEGQELDFYVIDQDTLVASSPGMDYVFVRESADLCD